MSDSLGDGGGRPTDEQVELYRRWSSGGAALSLIGEVQVDHRYPEKPGNLVLGSGADDARLGRLADAGSADGALDLAAARSCRCAGSRSDLSSGGSVGVGYRGSAVRCAHPVRRRRVAHDLRQGSGSCSSCRFQWCRDTRRPRLLVEPVPVAVVQSSLRSLRRVDRGPDAGCSSTSCGRFERRWARTFAIAVKINSSDQLEGGLSEDDALVAISLLGDEGVDLIDISGGTYFPGAPASSDRRSSGPYFLDFARRARTVTDVPLMLTGGFKTRGRPRTPLRPGRRTSWGSLGRWCWIPTLRQQWLQPDGGDPQFPRFDSPPAGGITAWFTMRLTALANGNEGAFDPTLSEAIDSYEARDAQRVATWERAFDTRSRGVVPVE